ncbi:ImmA/IrrE family metallo-endopeptidase [Clostridium sp. D43t1_170807_H7]|uniref:ImmA/IrrE family metallo-endopeptidase n=1 Tax=Clostridium sp. D43t1_170807_H7 TaxID=2787140 RepID=UPI001899CE0A|nr:ImmA/IrrE family metallo-endopeptidase [Clostridium sp. D43t1_170807_H7]
MVLRIDKRDIEKKAIEIRQENNVQTYGIKDIFSLIEQKEIHHIRYPFGKDVLLGFSTVYEGKRVIVSNSSEILSREIFTIAHELGHIVFDFEDLNQELKIQLDLDEVKEDICEERAFYFANCFLMPENKLEEYIKYELKKEKEELNALDIVRIQIEFNVSYNAAVKRLRDIYFISEAHMYNLFNEKNIMKSNALFKMLNADEKLLRASEVISVPAKYLEYVTSNYNNDYIPYSSLEKALGLLNKDAEVFKKESEDNEEIDLDDLFEELE